jgi:predicted dehydrogenase
MKALKSGKHVFVEKPLCINENELAEIAAYRDISAAAPLHLLVGYNRRFSPLTKTLKDTFNHGPMAITYRINAGSIPRDSWIQDRDIGGGRIVGEVCHFVDFVTYINGSLPTRVFAVAMDTSECLNDTLNISLNFENGSIATISYFANGDKNLPKERVEVYFNGATAVLEDFKVLTIYARGKSTQKKLISQDKGQKLEVNSFINAILEGEGQVIPFKEIYTTSLVAFKVEESVQPGHSIKIE